MPPVGAPRPDDATYEAFAGYLETAIDRAAAAAPNPGRTARVHRLNRAESTNAIRDLLGCRHRRRTSLLPADDADYGFDNIGDVLSVIANPDGRLHVSGAENQPPGCRQRQQAARCLRCMRPRATLMQYQSHERGAAIRLARRHRRSATISRSTPSPKSRSTLMEEFEADIVRPGKK